MEKSNELTKLYKFFSTAVVVSLPIALLLKASVTKDWQSAWISIVLWTLLMIVCEIWELFVQVSVEYNPRIGLLIERKISFPSLNLYLIQILTLTILRTVFVTFYYVIAVLNVIAVTNEAGAFIGTLSMLGVLSNLFPQCNALMGRTSWGMSLAITEIGIMGIIPFATGNFIVAALFFSFPIFAYLLAYLSIIANNIASNIDLNNFSLRRKILFKIFVEEYINERDNVQRRWRKKGFTALEIRLKTILLDLDTLRGLLICKMQNIGFNNSRIE